MKIKIFWNWLKNLFKKRRPGGQRPALWPTREEILLLPWFEGLAYQQIEIIHTPEAAARAKEELLGETVVGFDTESKPTFRKGETSHGPHVVQFSTVKKAYVVQLFQPQCRQMARELIELSTVKKVGFGLNHDLKSLRSKLHATPRNVLDVENLFREKGFGRGVGAKVGIALMFKKRLRKSSRVSTSNWGAKVLTEQQILYAGNDAYAAIAAYNALLNR